MGEPQQAHGEPLPYEPSDEEIDTVLAEFEGDPRRAIAGLLKDLATLASDQARVVSYGYLRGRPYPYLDTLKLP